MLRKFSGRAKSKGHSVTVDTSGMDSAFEFIKQYADDVILTVARAIITEAGVNIAESGKDQSGSLLASLKIVNDNSGLRIVSDSRYADVRNMPVGQTLVIRPRKPDGVLRFVDDGRVVFTKYVIVEGNAFFDRAVDTVMGQIPLIVGKMQETQTSKFRITNGRRVYTGGNKSLSRYFHEL